MQKDNFIKKQRGKYSIWIEGKNINKKTKYTSKKPWLVKDINISIVIQYPHTLHTC